MKIHNKWKITVKESAWNLGITTKRSPTKRSLTNCSRQMVHGWWLGLGFKFRVRDMVSVRVSEPLFVNHFLLNVFSVNVLSWNRNLTLLDNFDLHIAYIGIKHFSEQLKNIHEINHKTSVWSKHKLTDNCLFPKQTLRPSCAKPSKIQE